VCCPRSSQCKTSNAVDDVVLRLDPYERLGIGVVIGQVYADGIVKRTRAAVAAAANLLFSQLSKPALHLIDPGRVGGREVKVEARVPKQPAVDQRRLVGAVVVQDEMHLQVRWHFRVNTIEELAELGGAVSSMQFTDDFAGGHIQCGKQRRSAVTFVVVPEMRVHDVGLSNDWREDVFGVQLRTRRTA